MIMKGGSCRERSSVHVNAPSAWNRAGNTAQHVTAENSTGRTTGICCCGSSLRCGAASVLLCAGQGHAYGEPAVHLQKDEHHLHSAAQHT